MTAKTRKPVTPPDTVLLKPGLLIHLTSTVKGGIEYNRTDLPAEGPGITKWETTKIVEDPKEVRKAGLIRSRALNEVRSVCAVSTHFGLMCPIADEKKLRAAIARAKKMCEAHNQSPTTKCTRIRLYATIGTLVVDDGMLRDVAAEIRELIATMDQGLKDLDVDAVRKAASEARLMLTILSDDKRKVANAAIEAAREAANTLAERVIRKGEKATKVFKDLSDELETVGGARAAFLEVPTGNEPTAAALPPVDLQRFASIGEEV